MEIYYEIWWLKRRSCCVNHKNIYFKQLKYPYWEFRDHWSKSQLDDLLRFYRFYLYTKSFQIPTEVVVIHLLFFFHLLCTAFVEVLNHVRVKNSYRVTLLFSVQLHLNFCLLILARNENDETEKEKRHVFVTFITYTNSPRFFFDITDFPLSSVVNLWAGILLSGQVHFGPAYLTFRIQPIHQGIYKANVLIQTN